MKIKINKSGVLELERKGKMKVQHCPFSEYDLCGDWCPLFQVIERRRLCSKSDNSIEIWVCQGRIYNTTREDFTDER